MKSTDEMSERELLAEAERIERRIARFEARYARTEDSARCIAEFKKFASDLFQKLNAEKEKALAEVTTEEAALAIVESIKARFDAEVEAHRAEFMPPTLAELKRRRVN